MAILDPRRDITSRMVIPPIGGPPDIPIEADPEMSKLALQLTSDFYPPLWSWFEGEGVGGLGELREGEFGKRLPLLALAHSGTRQFEPLMDALWGHDWGMRGYTPPTTPIPRYVPPSPSPSPRPRPRPLNSIYINPSGGLFPANLLGRNESPIERMKKDMLAYFAPEAASRINKAKIMYDPRANMLGAGGFAPPGRGIHLATGKPPQTSTLKHEFMHNLSTQNPLDFLKFLQTPTVKYYPLWSRNDPLHLLTFLMGLGPSVNKSLQKYPSPKESRYFEDLPSDIRFMYEGILPHSPSGYDPSPLLGE